MPPRRLASVSIPVLQTDSPVIDLRAQPYQHLIALAIVPPAGLAEATLIYVATEPTGTFVKFQRAGADVAVVAGKATQIDTHELAPWGAVKLVAAAVAAERVFELSGGETEPA